MGGISAHWQPTKPLPVWSGWAPEVFQACLTQGAGLGVLCRSIYQGFVLGGHHVTQAISVIARDSNNAMYYADGRCHLVLHKILPSYLPFVWDVTMLPKLSKGVSPKPWSEPSCPSTLGLDSPPSALSSLSVFYDRVSRFFLVWNKPM
jgi:hypothetical protein